MSFICLTSSQVLIAANLSKSDREQVFVKSWQYGFALVSLLPKQVGISRWCFFLVYWWGHCELPSRAKYPEILDHGQNVIALVCSPSLALLANNYEFLSCRFFVGLLMRAMGLSVCVNGFRKFMQLATQGAGRTNNNQPSPKRLFTRATINTHPTPPWSACYASYIEQQPYNAVAYSGIPTRIHPLLNPRDRSYRAQPVQMWRQYRCIAAFNAPTAPNPCHSVSLPCI